jgi:hypothetical protein
METLKNSYKINIIFSLALLMTLNLRAQINQPKIDIEVVRNKIISQGNYMFPEDFIRNLDSSLFNIFYVDNYCLVHVPYRNSDTYSTEPLSIIAIYILENNTWKFQNTQNYYYKLIILNEQNKIFLSNNLFCSGNMDCNSYVEISKFENNMLLKQMGFNGFDKNAYYDRLFLLDQKSEIIKAIGDTIANQVSFKNFNFESKDNYSFDLYREISILKDVKDTLVIKTIKNTKKMNF